MIWWQTESHINTSSSFGELIVRVLVPLDVPFLQNLEEVVEVVKNCFCGLQQHGQGCDGRHVQVSK